VFSFQFYQNFFVIVISFCLHFYFKLLLSARLSHRNSVRPSICHTGVILPKCLFVSIVMYAYFIYISQGSVERHLWCGRIYNNHIIANCLQRRWRFGDVVVVV